MQEDVAIKKYIVKFSIAYAIGSILIVAIFTFFDLDHSSGASIVVLVGAAMYTVVKFIEEYKRIPNKIEKSKLVWLSLISSYIISISLAFVMILFIGGVEGLTELVELLEKLNIVIILGTIAVLSLILYAVLFWTYGSLAKKQYELLQKKGKI